MTCSFYLFSIIQNIIKTTGLTNLLPFIILKISFFLSRHGFIKISNLKSVGVRTDMRAQSTLARLMKSCLELRSSLHKACLHAHHCNQLEFARVEQLDRISDNFHPPFSSLTSTYIVMRMMKLWKVADRWFYRWFHCLVGTWEYFLSKSMYP